MKHETVDHFIARMKGREFTSGDVSTCCGVAPSEVRRVLAPHVKAARVVSLGASARDGSVKVWKATGL